ncbi:hypothetical protein [Azospirillum picis]|uniref:Uncharacterized protein n=1 Tax=Azospirillum picis TaxID=488438 RepID=A0ABU0MSQ4_9PROT|nr:hypothetical protein [Azospirillum picis]MBP2302820.1 hypothetical protein [Azospirillum picis]MDQ0536518.1 hypothetical protein [Azospirillum picis]
MRISKVSFHLTNYYTLMKFKKVNMKENNNIIRDIEEDAFEQMERALSVKSPTPEDIKALLLFVYNRKPKWFKGNRPESRALRLILAESPD